MQFDPKRFLQNPSTCEGGKRALKVNNLALFLLLLFFFFWGGGGGLSDGAASITVKGLSDLVSWPAELSRSWHSSEKASRISARRISAREGPARHIIKKTRKEGTGVLRPVSRNKAKSKQNKEKSKQNKEKTKQNKEKSKEKNDGDGMRS